jgi:23S rRNA pseudouridine1911/1915/1917 synthase
VREQIPAALAGERVDRAVALLTGLPRSEVAALVDAGAVHVGGRVVTSRSRKVSENEVLEVDVPAPAPADDGPQPDPSVDFPVVHADEHVIVVDKPAGLVVHPGSGNNTGTLVHGLLARFPDLAGVGPDRNRPGIVHRLDKGTSGLLVVARSAVAYDALVAELKERKVERLYLALVWGDVSAPAGLIDAPIGRASNDPTRMAVSSKGREARTRYEVLTRYTEPAPVTLVECKLETGRTHQIRVHLAAIGHPVVGDVRYRGGRAALPVPRPFLHAHRLAFDHPGNGERVTFSSPLAPDLEAVRAGLR